MRKPKTILGATSILLGKCDSGSFREDKLAHIADVIFALCENPDSVRVDTSLIDQVWERLNWYLNIRKKGFLLILLNADHWKKKEKIVSTISLLGIKKEQIRVIQPALNMTNATEVVLSRDCRLVIYSKGCPRNVVDNLSPEISVQFKNLYPASIRRALTDLSEKLKD